LVGQTMAGRATAYERECLERVRSESKLALNHINEAIQRLFETTASPTELAKHQVRRIAPGDRPNAGLFIDDREEGK